MFFRSLMCCKMGALYWRFERDPNSSYRYLARSWSATDVEPLKVAMTNRVRIGDQNTMVRVILEK